ncbi:helix-turn-helix transcriptional regulator [Sulfitobacter sabulilitoris]|uniref:HTH domain-containing protein n=1 Tax=Sulfitobacter sabulilitoris TaxID=2562655 RepID=A0A5S3PKI2_9RHOB|nr:HTH domain-containing protein [Sulfitobacter sabulilitoris]TMM54919.1 HTH domain-containing protein [Sulfitobacter sabulilitoris]
MSRSDRLLMLIDALRDGALHRAGDLAARLGVSQRTLYRDIDRLVAAGVPVTGTRGLGYRLSDAISLPPLTLTLAEVEALQLGIAIVSEATDDALKSAALGLADKIDAALPDRTVPQGAAWAPALSPFANSARGISHMPTLRAAIRARQKLRVVHTDAQGRVTTQTLRPLRLEHWGRIWTLTAWSDTQQGFVILRTDLIDTADALPELFVDEPGKTLADAPA